MSIPNQYIPLFKKLATYGEPDYGEDSQQEALEQVEDNRKDVKSALMSLFDNVGSVEKHQTKLMDKTLPGKIDKETANPLIKTARQPDHYRMVSRLAFKDELEKIASLQSR